MCQQPEGLARNHILAGLRDHKGTMAFDLFEGLQAQGLCIAHFCEAVKALAAQGHLRGKNGEPLLDPWLPAAQILRLALVPVHAHPPGSQRQLPEGFTIFLDKVLGRGGVGVVYLGEQVRLKRPVAIKLLRLKQLPEGISADWFADKFRREPRLIARLNHPHIVQVIDCGEDGEDLWYAMEYLEGGTLLERIRTEGKLPIEEVRAYFKGTAEALAEAKRHGVLHRDVKPGNIFNRGIKLADFGLAKSAPAPGDLGAGAVTQLGTMLGTPTYVAPERASFQPGDFRSDIYSLGATMYYAASGNYLFDLSPLDRSAWYQAHLNLEPRRITDRVPGFPPGLAAALHKCLAKNPSDRYLTFELLIKDLSRGD